MGDCSPVVSNTCSGNWNLILIFSKSPISLALYFSFSSYLTLSFSLDGALLCPRLALEQDRA
eukprot:1384423-Amorphochlora_amoeboformis.AAC.1